MRVVCVSRRGYVVLGYKVELGWERRFERASSKFSKAGKRCRSTRIFKFPSPQRASKTDDELSNEC